MTERAAEEHARMQKLGLENTRLRADCDALLAAAKRVIEICEDQDSSSADVPWSLRLLKDAIAKAEEQAP